MNAPGSLASSIDVAASSSTMARADGLLRTLVDPALDPFFPDLPLQREPCPPDPEAGWMAHGPFLHWLVLAHAPSIVAATEAASHILDDALRDAGLPTRQIKLDHQQGLPAGAVAHGSLDLLLLEWPRGTNPDTLLGSWKPFLSPRAALLFRGLDADPETGPAGWGAWDALEQERPRFSFFHGGGLGVLCLGEELPAALAELCGGAPDFVARLRHRLAYLAEGPLGAHARARQARQVVKRESLLAEREHALRALRLELADSKAARHDAMVAEEKARQAAEASEAESRQAAELASELQRAQEEARDAQARLAALAAERDAHRARAQAFAEASRTALAARDAALIEAERRHADAARRHEEAAQQQERDIAALRATLGETEAALQTVQNSASWRVTRPLRLAMSRIRRTQATSAPSAVIVPQPSQDVAPAILPTGPDPDWTAVLTTLPPVPSEPDLTPALPQIAGPGPAPVAKAETPIAEQLPTAAPLPQGWRPVRRVLFVSGEPNTPGSIYRCRRMAAACATAGFETQAITLVEVSPDNLAWADLVVFWRARSSQHVETAIRLAQAAGTRVALDLDDLTTRPDMAWNGLVDGVRTIDTSRSEADAYFTAMLHTLEQSDLCIATTEALATQLRRQHPTVHVLPNTFDDAALRLSRYAVRHRAERGEDGLLRIGYAGGTRTHQKDFGTVAPSLARVLEQRPDARLVLFREAGNKRGLLLMDEFPALLPFFDQIEWRDLVPLERLPTELARFDVSICPLEKDNPFCESKSELKYFEAALAGVPTIATPTAPYRDAIRHGVTGFLAETPAEWDAALLQLLDDPALRARVAHDAYHDALWQWGPQRLASLIATTFGGLDNDPAGARATELALRRGAFRVPALPDVPDAELLFRHDALGEAEVTVTVTSFNYARFILEALESARAQTLSALDLVVVDDGSTDESVPLVLDWAERHKARFNRLLVLRTRRNAGLGGARNVAVAATETPFFMVLDADNRLLPQACETLLAAATARVAAFAYPHLQQFDGLGTLLGVGSFDPAHLRTGNYIDAMALVAKWAWAAAGGFYVQRDAMGWEDFDLWCRLVEIGQFGVEVPEVLAEYRVHDASMTNSWTEQRDEKRRVVGLVEERHPWLRLRTREAKPRW